MLTDHQYSVKVAAIHKLRVNVKSLAAEAKLIRHEERRAGPAYREELASHRRGRLRREARVAQLALAYVRGKPYRAAEPNCHEDNCPNAGAITAKLRRLGGEQPFSLLQAVEAWLEGK